MSKNILLIEDEDLIRDLYKRQLDRGDFLTDAFATGKGGLQALSQKKYDLVLLDIMLPDMNGLKILNLIKQNPLTKGIPIILLTNISQDQIVKQGLQEGAAAYLLKATITPDQILEEIKNIFNKSAGTKTSL